MRTDELERWLLNLLRLSLLIILWTAITPSYANNEERGRVIYLRGSVTATNTHGVPRLLRQDSRVKPGDEIETGPKAVIQLVFPDGAMLQIKRSSKVVIEAYHYNAKDPDKDKTIFKAIKGSFRSLTGALGKRNPDKVKYKTPVATIGIRGTAVEIGTDDQGLSFANFDFGQGVISTKANRSALKSGQNATIRTRTDQIQTGDLQRTADDPASVAKTIVGSEHKGGISNAEAICDKLSPEEIFLLVAIQRHVPEFKTSDLMASIEGLAGCLSIDIASPMLTVSSAVYPESADKLLGSAVKGGFNMSLALDGVLRGMDNAESGMVERVIIDAVKKGISKDEAHRMVTGLREDGLCR